MGLASALTCQYFAAKTSQGFGTVLRNEMFAHINAMSQAEIDRFGAPSLVTRITNDVNQLQQAVAMLIRLAIRAPFLVIGSIVMALIIDPAMALIFLIAAIAIGLVLWAIMSRTIPFYRASQKLLDNVSLRARETLSEPGSSARSRDRRRKRRNLNRRARSSIKRWCGWGAYPRF